MEATPWALLLVLPILLSGGTAWATPQEDDVGISYRYDGSGSFRGTLDGSCKGSGGVVAPGFGFAFRAEDVRISWVTVWLNRTSIAPDDPGIRVETPLDHNITTRTWDLPDGPYSIDGGTTGLIALRPYGHPASDEVTFDLQITANDADWTGAREGFAGPTHYVEDTGRGAASRIRNGLGEHDGRYPDGSRGFAFGTGVIEGRGAATLHLRDVTLHGPRGELRLPPYSIEVQNTTAPANGFRTTSYRLEEAFLDVGRIAFRALDLDATWVCGAMEARLDGEATVNRASGEAKNTRETLRFEDRALTVDGVFSLREAPRIEGDAPTVDAHAEGDISIIGLDFRAVAVTGLGRDVVAKLGIGVLVAGALGFAAKKLAPAGAVLYARLSNGDLRKHPVRAALLELLAKDKVLALGKLVVLVGTSRGNVRHHIDILERGHLVTTGMFEGEILVATSGQEAHGLILVHLLQDERFRAIHEAFVAGQDRSNIVQAVQERFGVAARTARKSVRKYQELVARMPLSAGGRVECDAP